MSVQPPPADASADRYSQWLSVPTETAAQPAPPPPPEPAPRSPEPAAPAAVPPPASTEPVRATTVEPQPRTAPAPEPYVEPARIAADRSPPPEPYPERDRYAEPYPERDRYAEPVRPRLAGVDPREPVRSRDNRGLLIGGAAAAVLLAALAGWALTRDRDAPGAVVETVPAQGGPTGETGAGRTPTQAAYAPPDREAVRDAYGEVGRVYSTAGVSGLAEAGRSCFANLGEAPSYRGLDYCGALDAYGAAFATRVSGSPAPAESWFGQAEGRFVQAAERVMGPERDAAARLVDIRRLAIEVAREGSPAVAAAGGPRPAAAPQQQTQADAGGSVQVTPAEPPSATAPPPTPARRAEAPAQAAPRVAPEPPNPEGPDRETYAAARPRDPGPTAAEVAAARPRQGRGPSFNCRYARSTSERLVCEDAELAALDRRLNAAFEDAIAAGVPRRALRREQDGWLAEREAAAPDRDAVRDAYRRRIRELNQLQ